MIGLVGRLHHHIVQDSLPGGNMSTTPRERFLFVVTVNTDKDKDPARFKAFTNQVRLKAFTAKMDSQPNGKALIAEVQERFQSAAEDSALAKAQPELLAIDWYEDTFVCVLDLNID